MAIDNFRRTDVVLDKANGYILDEQFGKVGDIKGRDLVVQITNNGVIQDQSGLKLVLAWTHNQIKNTGIEPFIPLNAAQGIFKVTYPAEMMNEGFVTANIGIVQSGGTTFTRNFTLRVEKNAGNADAAITSDSWTVLVDALEKVNNAEQLLKNTIAGLEEKYGSSIGDMGKFRDWDATLIKKMSNEFGERGINVKWLGAKGDGDTDDSTAIQNAIQLARDNFSNHTGSNAVIIPQGTYFLQSTIELPPYVKLTSTGLVKLVSGVTDGALIHIKYDDADTAAIANEYTRGEYTRGALINGASGGFNLINKSATKTGIAILIGDNTDRSSSLAVSRFSLTDLTINGFSIAIKHNVYNVYLGVYTRLHLEQNTTNVQFGDADHVDVVNSGENMAFNNCVFAGAENSFVWHCGGFDCNFNNCSMDFNANVFDLKRGWKSINYLGGHIEGCPKVFYYETTNASDVYFKQSSAPTFNFYGTIMFCNPAEDSYLFETKNDATKAHLLLSNPRFIVTQPGLNNYYLANKNVDVNCQGITTQSENLIPIAENINPVPAWSYQDTAKFTVNSGAGVEGSFTTTGIPENKFGTVFSGLGKGSVNPWTTLTTHKFTVVNKSNIFSKILYFCEGTFRYAEIKYKFYDYSQALISETSQGVNFIEAGADKWIQGSLLQSVPGGAVSCETVITVSKIDSGKRAYVGPIMCSAI